MPSKSGQVCFSTFLEKTSGKSSIDLESVVSIILDRIP